MKVLGERLKAAMRAASLTQAEVAEKMGCSKQAVSKWMAGGGIDIQNLCRLAEILGTNWVVLGFDPTCAQNVCDSSHCKGCPVMKFSVWHEIGALWRSVLQDAVDVEHKARMILGMLKIGIWEYDMKTTKRFWSPTAKHLLGYTPSDKEPDGQLRDHVLPDYVFAVDKFFKKLVMQKGVSSMSIKITARPEAPLMFVGVPIVRDDNVDKVIGLVMEEGTATNLMLSTMG